MRGNHCECSLCKSALYGRNYILYQEAALFLTVHINTVRNYIADGKFRAVTLHNGSKDRRIIYASFHDYIRSIEADGVIEEPAADPAPQPCQPVTRSVTRRRVLSNGF